MKILIVEITIPTSSITQLGHIQHS